MNKLKTLMDCLVQRIDTTEAPPGMQSVLDAVKLAPELEAQIQRNKVDTDPKAALEAARIHRALRHPFEPPACPEPAELPAASNWAGHIPAVAHAHPPRQTA